MKKGYLSEYFSGLAAKKLSAVEVDTNNSNQHEFNGDEGLKKVLGEADEKIRYSARFLYLNDHDTESVFSDAALTWYDARAKARVERGVMRHEYRLYFTANQVMECASAGDLLIIAKRRDESLLAVIAKQGSTTEQQLLWLFGLGDLAQPGFSAKSGFDDDSEQVGFAARIILEQIGIEPFEDAPDYLGQMLDRFGGNFPGTKVFSAYARETALLNSQDDPDGVLVAWMEREEILFRTLERHLLAEQLHILQQVKEIDPDAYMKLTMSFQQRRKSRAGSALENHLEEVFKGATVTYTRTGITENNLKPDFVFPGIESYHSEIFPTKRLTILAAKTTCKDRWRQILNEAARVREKHLLTLEPRISENQTNEMRGEAVQLVIPKILHATYSANQQPWLLNLGEFLALVRSRQDW